MNELNLNDNLFMKHEISRYWKTGSMNIHFKKGFNFLQNSLSVFIPDKNGNKPKK